MNRSRQTVYIEQELLDAIHGDLNFEINLALEHRITKHHGARVAIERMED